MQPGRGFALGRRRCEGCDSKMVHEMALRGQAFEQNQMGIASVLAIGPDYSAKEALTWFRQAAQRGYAPAQVNRAVMHINGWGTPVRRRSRSKPLTRVCTLHRGRFRLGACRAVLASENNSRAYDIF